MNDNSDACKNSDYRSEFKEMDNPSAVLGNMENINADADTIVSISNSFNEKRFETIDEECRNIEIVENQNRDGSSHEFNDYTFETSDKLDVIIEKNADEEMDVVENKNRVYDSREIKHCHPETYFSEVFNKIRENRNMFKENKQFCEALKKIGDEIMEIIKTQNSQEDHKVTENENIAEKNKQLDGISEKNADEEMDVVKNENYDYDSHEFKHSDPETNFSQEDHKIRENKNMFEENKQLNGTLKEIDDEEMEIITNQNSQEDRKIIESNNPSEMNEQFNGMPEKTSDEEMEDVENQNDDVYGEFERSQTKIGISQAGHQIMENANIVSERNEQLDRTLEKIDDVDMKDVENQNQGYKYSEFDVSQSKIEIFRADYKTIENKNMFEDNKQLDIKLENIEDAETRIIKNENSEEDNKIIESENIDEKNEQLDRKLGKIADEEMKKFENQMFEENKQLDIKLENVEEEEIKIIKIQNSEEDNKMVENENIAGKNEQLDRKLGKITGEDMKNIENQNQNEKYHEFDATQSEIGTSQANHKIIENKNNVDSIMIQLMLMLDNFDKELDGAFEKLDEKAEIIKIRNSQENYKITQNEEISEKNKKLNKTLEKKAGEEEDILENQKHDGDANYQSENEISQDNNKIIENNNIFEKNEKLDGVTEKKANEELDIAENQKHDNVNCHPESKISQESNKIIENKTLFERNEMAGMTEKKANGEMDNIENQKRDDDDNCVSKNKNSHENSKISESEDTILQMKKQLELSKEANCGKNDALPLAEEEFTAILSSIKTEENDPMFETSDDNQVMTLKVGAKRKKKVPSSNENLIPIEYDKTIESQTIKEEPFEPLPFEAKENSENDENEVKIVKETYGITVPLIGKAAFQNNEKPLTSRYDLAIERNERRCASSKKADDEIMKLIREEERMSESEKNKKAERERQGTINTACYITHMGEKILRELKNGLRNEKKVLRCLRRFLYSNLSPSCLLYVPHLIHTLCFIRGNKKISRPLRVAANECYNMCHAMFPIPPGYNFETVYTSEMRKFLPDDFEKFLNNPLEYGDADDILDHADNDDSSDSAYNSGSNSIL